ncbi:MAG: hypothetical protein RL346_40 [Verrucomicrobiota bacterium]|jgi:hypothetical protein
MVMDVIEWIKKASTRWGACRRMVLSGREVSRPGSTVGEIDGFDFSGRCAGGETPSDLVALGSGAEFALFAFGRGFERATTAHFFKNTLGIEFGFEAFESTIHGLSFFDVHSTHADVFPWLYL